MEVKVLRVPGKRLGIVVDEGYRNGCDFSYAAVALSAFQVSSASEVTFHAGDGLSVQSTDIPMIFL